MAAALNRGVKGRCAVNLHNAVAVAQARLGRLVNGLSAARMEEACAALGIRPEMLLN